MKRLLLLALILLLGALTPTVANAEGDVTLLFDTPQINFPRSIVFKAEIKAGAEIKSVELVYALGSRNVRSRGYPTFEKAAQTQTEFVLRTTGDAYIPPGTEVRYFYVVEDVNGNRTETEPRTFLYMDTRFNWQTVEKDLVTVYYHDLRSPSPAERVLAVVLATNERMGDILGARVTRPTKVVMYNSKTEMDVALPFQSETTRRELVTEGQAYADFDLFLSLGNDPNTIAHEFTHLLVDKAADNAFGGVPAWLNEGLAVYAQSQAGDYVQVLNQAIRRNSLLLLRGMDGRPGRPDEVILFYGQAFSTVKYLIDTYGQEKMQELLAAIKQGLGTEGALKKVYGFGVDELENQWRVSVRAKPREISGPSSGQATPQVQPTLVPFGAQPQPTAAPSDSEPRPAPTPVGSSRAQSEEVDLTPWLAAGGMLFLLLIGGVATAIILGIRRE